jgi:non-specific serine/threonine protein kinase
MSPERAIPERAANRTDAESGAEFIRQVRDALRFLHDRTRLQTHPLASFASPQSDKRASGRGKRLQDDLLQAIEALKPSPQVPGDAVAARTYQLLVGRYVDAEETTEVQRRLAIGKTEYYADHQRALNAVASILWERWRPEASEEAKPPGARGSVGTEAIPPTNPIAASRSGSSVSGASIERPRHNLPAQLTSFVGRQREIEEVRRLLNDHRLVTLTGIGGCGKTRLALQAAAEVSDAYADGVWLVELAPLTDPALVAPAVAAAIGVREESGQPLLATLLAALRARHLLLVLDNCEHLLDACAQLAEVLLRGCPHLRILATSREALGIGGEVARRVPSLVAPPPGQLPLVERLTEYEAVQLFVERALAVQPAFVVTEQNAPAVAQLCWRLDGIPLALELAAARVRVLTVEQITSRLGDRFRLLTGGSRTALRRQQTLAAAIDWSHDLLTDLERALLRRLAVFAGGWTLETAEGVGVDEGAGDWGARGPAPSTQHLAPILAADVLDLLTGLVDKSLVLAEGQGTDTRYRLLETIRQYAGEKLLAAGEAEAVRDRHLDWYLALAEEAKPELLGPNQVAWLDRLEREQDNLRAALEWALDRGSADRALRLAGAAWRLWHVRDNPNEGREWLLRVLAMPGAGAPTRARAEALDGACELVMRSRAADPAVPRLGEECLAIYRSLGDRRGTAWARCHLAANAAWAGNTMQAEELAAEALTLAREADAQWVVAQALEALGLVAGFRGDYPLARRRVEESVAIFRAFGDRRAIGHGLGYLAWSTCEQGDAVATRTYLSEWLTLARELRSKSQTWSALYGLGLVARLEGDLARSRTLLEECLALCREEGHRGDMGLALLNLGRLAQAERDVGWAESWLRQSVTVFRDLGDQAGVSAAVGFFGVLAICRGAHRKGARLLGAVGPGPAPSLPLTPDDRRAYAESIAAARVALGEHEFAVAWAQGQAMTLEQAVAYALSDDSPGE